MLFAFLVMGNYDSTRDRAAVHGGDTRMIGVKNLDDACGAARELLKEGVSCIELCGAFGPDGARRIIEATGGKIPVGYVTHFPEQDELFDRVFGSKK